MSLDDLRLRLDSPLFAREPGLAAAAPVPYLRELTWEHVINPTTSQPVVPGESGDAGDHPRPAPIRIEDVLARPEPTLAPLPDRADAPATSAPDAPAATGMEAIPLAPAALAPMASVTGSLPTFAAMLSGEVATVSSWSGDRLGTEDLVKPIEEPPPVARDTDPQVNDLAALILRSPNGDEPNVEAEAARADDAVAEPLAMQTEAQPAPPVHSMMSPPLVRDTGVNPVVAGSPVEAELNRLAYVPDVDDGQAGPVPVPEIAYSDVRPAAPVQPVPPASATGPTLSQHEMFMPRQVTTVHRQTYSDMINLAPPAPRRRKRHVFRKIVTTLVLLGMVAGGLFAVKHYVLDRVNWPKEIAPLATAVENERGLHFLKSVPVATLPATDYALKLDAAVGGITDATKLQTTAMWRALGLMSGSLDERTIGLVAAADSPAFYDTATKQIYVIDGLKTELHTFALHRALTMALLDQQFKWSAQLDQAAPTVVIGTRALFDADAVAVAEKLLSDEDRAVIPDQQQAISTTNSISSNPAPFASATMGRLGVALWPYLDSLSVDKRNELEQSAFMTDDHALDLRRLTTGATDTVGTTTQGMLFWYHVLAGRVDDDFAWRTALGWRGDDVTVDTTTATMCMSANVTIDASVAKAAQLVFAVWAAAAPKESATTVAMTFDANGAGHVTIHACDPGPSVATNDGKGSLTLGGAPLRVEQFVELVGSHRSISATQAACAVYGDDPLTADDERALVDPSTGWAAPAKHPAPDPNAAGCAPQAAPAATANSTAGSTPAGVPAGSKP